MVCFLYIVKVERERVRDGWFSLHSEGRERERERERVKLLHIGK